MSTIKKNTYNASESLLCKSLANVCCSDLSSSLVVWKVNVSPASAEVCVLYHEKYILEMNTMTVLCRSNSDKHFIWNIYRIPINKWGRRGGNHMIGGFTTTCAASDHHH
jgi:hypothetical protein